DLQIERRLRTIRIDEKAFDALQKAENALERALAALAAASVGIRVRTRDRATIEIDEGQGDEGDAPGVAGGATKARPLDTNAWNDLRLDRRARIVVGDDLVEIEIEPGGGEDLEARRRGRDEALRNRDRLLSELGVASLDEARAALAERRRLEKEISEIDARLGVLAKGGVEALRLEV